MPVIKAKDLFMDLSPEDKFSFFIRFPSLFESWFLGLAMGQKFKSSASVEQAGAMFYTKWDETSFKAFLRWALFLSKLAKHKPMKLYRLIGLPYTEKKKFRLVNRNAAHSWSTDIVACRYLFKTVYLANKVKSTKNWSWLIVSATVPGNRIAITHKEIKKLAVWGFKNSMRMYKICLKEGAIPKDYLGYKPTSFIEYWKDLNKRLNVAMIRDQKEVIVLGKKPLMVEVVETIGKDLAEKEKRSHERWKKRWK